MVEAVFDFTSVDIEALVSDLSNGDLVNGILLFVGWRKCSGQILLSVFHRFQTLVPATVKRFQVRGVLGGFRSDALQETLDFFTHTYRILETAEFYGGDERYKIRSDLRDSLASELRARGVLPRYEPTLRALAEFCVQQQVA